MKEAGVEMSWWRQESGFERSWRRKEMAANRGWQALYSKVRQCGKNGKEARREEPAAERNWALHKTSGRI